MAGFHEAKGPFPRDAPGKWTAPEKGEGCRPVATSSSCTPTTRDAMSNPTATPCKPRTSCAWHGRRHLPRGVALRRPATKSRASFDTGMCPHSAGMLGLGHRGRVDRGFRRPRRAGAEGRRPHHGPGRGGTHGARRHGRGLRPHFLANVAHQLPRRHRHRPPRRRRGRETSTRSPEGPFFVSMGLNETARWCCRRPRPPPGRGRAFLCPAETFETPEIRADVADFKASARIMGRPTARRRRPRPERDGLAENTLVFCFADHGLQFPRNMCQLGSLIHWPPPSPPKLVAPRSLLRWRACSGTTAPNRLAIVSQRRPKLSPHVPPFSVPRSSDHYGRSGAQVRDPAGARRAAARPRDQPARHAPSTRPPPTPSTRPSTAPTCSASARSVTSTPASWCVDANVSRRLNLPRGTDLPALAPRRQSPTRFPRDRASRETRRDPRTSPRGAPRASDADAPCSRTTRSFTIVSSGSIAPRPTIPTPR